MWRDWHGGFDILSSIDDIVEIIQAKAMVTIAMGGEEVAPQICQPRRPPAPSEATETAARRRRRRRRYGSSRLSKAEDVNVNNNELHVSVVQGGSEEVLGKVSLQCCIPVL